MADVMPEVNAVLEKMKTFSEAIISVAGKATPVKRSMRRREHRYRRLRSWPVHGDRSAASVQKSPEYALCFFNVDGTHIAEVLKTVTGNHCCSGGVENLYHPETMTNAHSARDWFLATAGDENT